ncbi:MAG: hypothetical protein K2N28_07910 [Muribaculaceae bacterium]|nr:hypothetical protein [Muribaculaceae bacterium]
MKNIVKTIVAALFILSVNIGAFAIPPLSTIQKVKDQVENIRYQLPAQAGYGLMLTQVSYDSQKYTIVYRYHYTVTAVKPSPEAINEAKQSIIHMLKANPNGEDMQFIKAGITFHYNYYNEDGTFLYAIKITPQDVK